MFGQNPIRQATVNPEALAIESHFYTLQGEGPFSGVAALFIRLSGCNLACHFCDTQFEKNAENATPVEAIVNDILEQYSLSQRKFVVITGGEPMRQDFSLLAEKLFASGTKLIQVETAGTLWLPSISSRVALGDIVLVCSPKTPKVHPMIGAVCHHWKYIITAGEVSMDDGLPNRGTHASNKDKKVILYRPAPRTDQYAEQPIIWVSPCDAYDPEQNKRNLQAAVNVALLFRHRLSLQVHKIAGLE